MMARDLDRLPPWVRFGFIGAVGFVVDAGVLQLMLSLAGWGPLMGRAVSFPAAVWATWYLNRRYTFGQAHEGSAWQSFVRYVLVSLGGFGVNLATYSALMLASPRLAQHPLWALAVASGVAMLFNYLGSKHYAFSRSR